MQLGVRYRSNWMPAYIGDGKGDFLFLKMPALEGD